MNWFANFYFAEGPGIAKDAPKPTGLRLLGSVLAREWWTLIQLNVLFIAFALPLVTLPAALFAMVSVSVTMIEDRNVWLFRNFWAAFRRRFVMSTLIGIAALCVGWLGYLAVVSYAQSAADNLVFAVPLAIAATVLVALPIFVAHLFVAMADTADHSFAEMVKAAALGILVRPLGNLAALLFVAFIWAAHVAFYPATILMPVIFNFVLTALVLGFAAHGGVQFGFLHQSAAVRSDRQASPETRSA